MTRTWARTRLDMKILELLYDYKSLRGTTLAKLCTPYDMQKTFDRITALVRIKKIESKTYMEQDARKKENSVNGFKKKGQMYYLSGEGVTAVKEYRGLPVKKYEQGIEVLDNQLKSLFTSSILIENINLRFRDGRSYKMEHELPNYITVDLVYEEWVIFVERMQTSVYRKKQCQIIKGLKENPKIGNIIIICPTEAQAIVSAKEWKDERGPDVRFMSRDNIQGIEKLLNGSIPAEVIQSVAVRKGQTAELSQPENGYTHVVNGESVVIKDLIGYSPKVMRQISSSLLIGKKKYLVVEKATQLPLIARRFPELLMPEHRFITLDGAYKTSENLHMQYVSRRKRKQA